MPDTIETFEDARLQYGAHNDRVYVMEPGRVDAARLLEYVEGLVREHGYSKVFAKVEGPAAQAWLDAGYTAEARVPGFFGGETEGVFLGKFFADWRAEPETPERLDEVRDTALGKNSLLREPLSDDDMARLSLGAEDMADLAELYGIVFASYPFPVHDPAYLQHTVDAGHNRYFGIREEGRLIAAASAELTPEASHAEMTDFATLPDLRGRGLAQQLLGAMEQWTIAAGYKTLFTIARAQSFGMNITFARLGYAYAGRLVRNTQISGSFESMNVWWRRAE